VIANDPKPETGGHYQFEEPLRKPAFRRNCLPPAVALLGEIEVMDGAVDRFRKTGL